MNQTVLGFIRKEFGQALRDPRMIAILFLMPVIQMLLFGYALRTDIRNIKLGVVSAPGDRLAGRIADRAFGSGFFVPVRANVAAPASDLASGRAHAVLISPPGGLDRAVARGEGRMQLLVDATNAIRARNVEMYLNRILGQIAQEESKPAALAPAGIKFDVRVLYNPALESRIFMVPAVAVFILGIVSVLLTSMAIAREKEMGTMEMLLSAPVAGWEIIAGKTIPYIVVAMIDAPIVLAVATLWFGVPMRGPVLVLAAAGASIYSDGFLDRHPRLHPGAQPAAGDDGQLHVHDASHHALRDNVPDRQHAERGALDQLSGSASLLRHLVTQHHAGRRRPGSGLAEPGRPGLDRHLRGGAGHPPPARHP